MKYLCSTVETRPLIEERKRQPIQYTHSHRNSLHMVIYREQWVWASASSSTIIIDSIVFFDFSFFLSLCTIVWFRRRRRDVEEGEKRQKNPKKKNIFVRWVWVAVLPRPAATNSIRDHIFAYTLFLSTARHTFPWVDLNEATHRRNTRKTRETMCRNNRWICVLWKRNSSFSFVVRVVVGVKCLTHVQFRQIDSAIF